jgi:hypothetical protein
MCKPGMTKKEPDAAHDVVEELTSAALRSVSVAFRPWALGLLCVMSCIGVLLMFIAIALAIVVARHF